MPRYAAMLGLCDAGAGVDFALVFTLVAVLHEVGCVGAGGVVGGKVGGDEEVGCVVGEVVLDCFSLGHCGVWFRCTGSSSFLRTCIVVFRRDEAVKNCSVRLEHMALPHH